MLSAYNYCENMIYNSNDKSIKIDIIIMVFICSLPLFAPQISNSLVLNLLPSIFNFHILYGLHKGGKEIGVQTSELIFFFVGGEKKKPFLSLTDSPSLIILITLYNAFKNISIFRCSIQNYLWSASTCQNSCHNKQADPLKFNLEY